MLTHHGDKVATRLRSAILRGVDFRQAAAKGADRLPHAIHTLGVSLHAQKFDSLCGVLRLDAGQLQFARERFGGDGVAEQLLFTRPLLQFLERVTRLDLHLRERIRHHHRDLVVSLHLAAHCSELLARSIEHRHVDAGPLRPQQLDFVSALANQFGVTREADGRRFGFGIRRVESGFGARTEAA